MNVPFLDLARQFGAFAPAIEDTVLAVSRSGAYILGPKTAELEAAISAYVGVPYSVAVSSGTSALHLALATLNIGPGDEVITTPFTFAATVEAIEYVGAQAVLVDIEADSFNIDVDTIDAAVTSKTKAIIPIHMFGLPADMSRLMAVAGRHDLKVVEDCAQSLGAALHGTRVGSFGHAAALSFYPTKTLGCLGDGGMVCVPDADSHQRLIELRNHGIGTGGEHVRLGFNARLDEIQAAVLLQKLLRLDEMNERRRQIAEYYNDKLAAAGAVVPAEPEGARHVYGYYTILVDDRDALRDRLQKAGVATALYYRIPVHHHSHFAMTCRYGDLPVAEATTRRCISLPIFPEMTDAEVEFVAMTVAESIS